MLEKRKEGSITVYLTLILFMILTLISTCLEAARVSVAKVFAGRVLNTAIRSTFGEYYLPLYENYHLFGLDIGYGGIDLQEEELVERLRLGMHYSLQPQKNSFLGEKELDKNFLICNPVLDKVAITGRNNFLANSGKVLKSQAIEYQKYSFSASVIEDFLERFHLVERTDKANKILSEKMEVESRLFEIDQEMLKLVQHMDGFLVEDTGLKLDRRGNPLTIASFAKKLVTFPVTKNSMQVSHEVLYEAIKDEYIRPSLIIQSLIAHGELARDKREEADCLSAELVEMRKDADYEDVNYVIKESELIYKIHNAEQECENNIKKINELQDNLKLLFSEVKTGIQESYACVQSIQNTRKEAKQDVEHYIKSIEDSKEDMEDSVYKQLMTDAKEMNGYTEDSVSKISIIYNITQMEKTLLHNMELIERIELIQIPNYMPYSSAYENWKYSLDKINNLCLKYSHDGLAIDYSSIQINKKSNEVLKNYKSLMNSGIAGLVIEDLEKISKASLVSDNLISVSYNIEKENSEIELNKLLQNVSVNKERELASNSLEKIGFPIYEILEEEGKRITENMLYIAYLEEHFANYLVEHNSEEKALSYEMEYILFGNETDQKNLESVAMRIVIIRTIMNMFHVLTDSSKTSTALQFATGVVGFTGLTFLISVTKYIVLFVWAFEAALIETAAILLGKEVPIIVTNKNFSVKFNELFTMGKSNIISKAKEYKSEGEPTFEYKDYLRLFLLIQSKPKQYYRTMDLIQENIRYVYDDNFLLGRCITNYEVEAEFYMPTLFLSMPFITNPDMREVSEYSFSIKAAVSY